MTVGLAVDVTALRLIRSNRLLGRVEYGEIDEEGQYVGDDDEIIEHVRAEYDVDEEIEAGVR